MQACVTPLKGFLATLLPAEKETILTTMAHVLSRLVLGEPLDTGKVKTLPDGVDALLLLDEWRLVQPVGHSATKAWEDTTQLLAMGRDFDLTFPAWIGAVVRCVCGMGRFQFREALLIFFTDEGHPARFELPAFLFELARASKNGIIDSAQINRRLQIMPLGVSADTLIAQLKNYGFISPHLRADFFRMRTPHYEIHPVLVHAATSEAPGPERMP